MADIINLRQARKAKARQAKEVEASENRAKHGVSKVDRTLDLARKAKFERDQDG